MTNLRCSIWWLLALRRQLYPWLVVILAPFNLLFASGIDRTHEQIRWMKAVTKIDLAGFYGLLNDLLV